jgi:hypothetical protein
MTRLALILALLAMPAHAQQPSCAKRDGIVKGLAEKYGEAQYTGGLRQQGVTATILEHWVNEATGTWTILETRPDGTSCILAAGTHFLRDEPMPPGERT